MKFSKKNQIFVLVTIILLVFFVSISPSSASKVEELKGQIEERSNNIGELEKEIEEYQREIDKVVEEKKTLSNEVYRLNLNQKKLTSDITLTNNKIYSTASDIEELSLDIDDKNKKIRNNSIALSESIRLMNEADSKSLVEIILSVNKISEFWDSLEGLQRFQIGVRENTQKLLNLKVNLEENRKETEEKKRELLNYRSDLADKKQAVGINKKEKDQLLALTKNKESNYKSILADKKKLMEEFQDEIKNLESQLKIEIDPNSIPDSEHGILKWPLDKVYITQYFGNTLFSKLNAQVYNGSGHPGVDLRASSWTKVKSSLGGVVKGVGNTDTVPPKCYSYGKWILIEHNNGLSTLYAHLSLIKVTPGQIVNTGDLIGYSGNTGYSTGPHLHFSVYATSGVKIQQFTKSINCKDKSIPIAPHNAYLNPLNYLPKY